MNVVNLNYFFKKMYIKKINKLKLYFKIFYVYVYNVCFLG